MQVEFWWETPKVILTRDTQPYTGVSSELITRSLPMHEASIQTSSLLMHLASTTSSLKHVTFYKVQLDQSFLSIPEGEG